MPLLLQVLHVAVRSPWYARFYEPWGAHLVAAEQSLSHIAAGGPGHNWLEVSWTQLTTHQCGYRFTHVELFSLVCRPSVLLSERALRRAPQSSSSMLPSLERRERI